MTTDTDENPPIGALREAVCHAGHHLIELGLSPGASGNISVRIGSLVLITPTGVALKDLTPSQLSVIGFDGEWQEGPKPSKEFPPCATICPV